MLQSATLLRRRSVEYARRLRGLPVATGGYTQQTGYAQTSNGSTREPAPESGRIMVELQDAESPVPQETLPPADPPAAVRVDTRNAPSVVPTRQSVYSSDCGSVQVQVQMPPPTQRRSHSVPAQRHRRERFSADDSADGSSDGEDDRRHRRGRDRHRREHRRSELREQEERRSRQHRSRSRSRSQHRRRHDETADPWQGFSQLLSQLPQQHQQPLPQQQQQQQQHQQQQPSQQRQQLPQQQQVPVHLVQPLPQQKVQPIEVVVMQPPQPPPVVNVQPVIRSAPARAFMRPAAASGTPVYNPPVVVEDVSSLRLGGNRVTLPPKIALPPSPCTPSSSRFPPLVVHTDGMVTDDMTGIAFRPFEPVDC
ncbi:MAG: hypothetical protein MHM6MM_007279 [Cercozoa sp. M6MM]